MNHFKLLVSLVGLLLVGTLQAQKTVKGKVTDPADNSPLPGVIVVEEGTNNNTVTSIDGDYTITVKDANSVLVFSLVGSEPQKIKADKDVLDVKLKTGTQLKEVVVTALGITREKKALGYSVSEVKGEDVAKSGEQNVIQGLAAKAPGIQVTSSGGTPGASSKITIRGTQTITGNNQPLIVIDGVPIDNSTNSSAPGDLGTNPTLGGVNNSNRALDINPDDIESVSILKGPAAAALYGARAGVGAIIYTTKKGKARKGLGVTYSTSYEILQVNKLPEKQLKYAQGTGGNFLTSDPGPDGRHNTDDDISLGTPNSWGPTVASLGLTPVDNAKNFFQLGHTYTNNIGVDGGNEKTTFRLSLGNTNNTGIIPNTYLKRNNISLRGDHKVNDKITVGTSLNYVNTKSLLPQNGSNVAGPMLSLMRVPASYDLAVTPDGAYANNGYNRNYFGAYDNPYYSVFHNAFDQNVNRLFGNTSISIKPLEWLDIAYKVGIDSYSDERRQTFAVSSNGDDVAATWGQVNYNTINQLQFYSDLILTARKKLGENFNASVTAGNNVWSNKSNYLYSRGRNLAAENIYSLDNASELYAYSYLTNRRTYAYFFDANFDYKGAIFLGVTGRNEWSSTFSQSKGKNNFYYPGANVSIIINELVTLPSWFNFAKVRAAYAQSGISPDPYSNQTIYYKPVFTDGFTNGLAFPYLGQNGFTIGNILSNPELRPERVAGQEYGIDLRFFDSRLTLDVTYYNQKTTDILLKRPTPPSSGYVSKYDNFGAMSNRGFEVAIGGTPVRTDDFKWNITATWYKNKNEVLKLAGDAKEIAIEEGFTGITPYAIVGQPYGVFYGTKFETTSDGKLIINPATGLPYLTPLSTNVGNPYPDWLSGIRNTLTYKGASLTFLFDIRKGGAVWNGTLARMNRLGTSKESEDREKTFVIEGVLGTGAKDDNGHPIATSTPNSIAISANNYWARYKGDQGGSLESQVEDGSWVRLREVGINYRLKFKDNKYVQYLDLGLTGRNLILWTKYKGVDPETSLTGAGSNIQGFDYFNNPGTRSYIITLKAGF